MALAASRPHIDATGRRSALTLAAAGAAAALLAACDRPGNPAPFQSIDVSGADWGRDFSLLDADGRTVRLADLKGRCVLLFVGFTQCPDVCPTALIGPAGRLRLAVRHEQGAASVAADVNRLLHATHSPDS